MMGLNLQHHNNYHSEPSYSRSHTPTMRGCLTVYPFIVCMFGESFSVDNTSTLRGLQHMSILLGVRALRHLKIDDDDDDDPWKLLKWMSQEFVVHPVRKIIPNKLSEEISRHCWGIFTLFRVLCPFHPSNPVALRGQSWCECLNCGPMNYRGSICTQPLHTLCTCVHMSLL